MGPHQHDPEKRRKTALILTLFLTFLKIGLFTFGGGYAMIPLIENICVEGLTFVCTDTGFEGRARFDRMIFITTSGGYIAPGADGGTDYLRNIASFTGSGCFEVYKAEGLDLQGNDPDQILRQAMDEVRKAASEAS